MASRTPPSDPSRRRPFDVLGYAARGPFTRDERAVLLALLVRADTGSIDLTAGQLAALAGGLKPLGAASVRSRVAPMLEAAGVISREVVVGASGRLTRWHVHPDAVQKVPRLHDPSGVPRPEARAWRAEVEALDKATRAQVDPAVREQARRASGVRSPRSPAPLRGPIGVIAGADHTDRGVRSGGAQGAITPIGPIHHAPARRALLSPSLPFSALIPQTPTASAGPFGARSALATMLQGIDNFAGVRTEGSALIVEIAGSCVPTDIDDIVDRFRAQHGISVSTEIDEAASPVMLAWRRARASIRRQLSARSFESYFGHITAAEDAGKLVLRARDGFFADWFALEYADRVLDALDDASTEPVDVLVECPDWRKPLIRPTAAATDGQEAPRAGRCGPERARPLPPYAQTPERAVSGRKRR